LVPSRGRIEWAALLGALLATVLIVAAKRALFGLPLAVDAAVLGSLVQLINWALTLIIWVTLIHVVISWVNPLAPVAPALAMLLRPLLGPIQRIVPAIAGIDLSPMVLLIVVYLLQIVLGRLVF
jgi:YggT family protein